MDDIEAQRLMHAVLIQHFLEGESQADIAERLGLSKSKVNRLITTGRKMGMVKISIETPFQHLLKMESALMQDERLQIAVVSPMVSGNPEATLRQVSIAAGYHLLGVLRDGDVIAITGGKAISEVVENLKPERIYDVRVVPLTGGVQGKFFTDVNNLVSKLAEKLGGQALVLHAPLFAESREQRDMLMAMSATREVFELSRRATVALVGIGSVLAAGSSYYDLHPMAKPDREKLLAEGVIAEFMAHLIHEDGTLAEFALNKRLVAVEPREIAHCPRIIGVAAGEPKVRPIMAVLNGGYITTLVTDEQTAQAVLNLKKGTLA
jgi:DNA-binding transcriptional regulator LsrR (DeoR family)